MEYRVGGSVGGGGGGEGHSGPSIELLFHTS